MAKLSRFWSNFVKMPADVPRGGLGRWFQILEEHFMPLFWTNLVTFAWLLPCFACLFFLTELWDSLSWAGTYVFFVLAGPGVTALHYNCMRIVRGVPVWWWDDYMECVRREWKKAMLLSAILGALWSGYVYALRLIIAVSGGLGLMYSMLFAVCGFVLTGLTALSYQQLANVELPFGNVLKNALLLIFAGKGRSFAAVMFALAALALCARYYLYAFFVLLVGFYAVGVMTFSLIFLPVFNEFFPSGDDAQ